MHSMFTYKKSVRGGTNIVGKQGHEAGKARVQTECGTRKATITRNSRENIAMLDNIL